MFHPENLNKIVKPRSNKAIKLAHERKRERLMAKAVENPKGFKVIKLTKRDAEHLGFGINGTGECLCMHCNEIIKGDIYYIAVLNDTMCEECYNKWVANATRYSEDIPYEEKQFAYIMYMLGY